MNVVSEKEQSSAADFNWSLFQFYQYLTEIRDWKLVDAILEIDRAIGRGEVPHRLGIDGKLTAGQGDPLFWQSEVQLYVSKDATGNVTNVQALGVHGWDHDRFTCGGRNVLCASGTHRKQHPRRKDSYSVPQRRRGPPTTHDWHSIDAEIASRCINPETKRLAVPNSERKLAEAMLQWCTDTFDREPALSEMRDAVRRICARLRQV